MSFIAFLYLLMQVFDSNAQSALVISDKVKLVIFVPVTHAQQIRAVLTECGAGTIGKYEGCSFSTRGIGRWKMAESDTMAEAEEERIETICCKDQVISIIAAVKKVHPYKEMGYDIYPLLALNEIDTFIA